MDSSASSVDTGDFKKNFFSLRAAVSQKRVRFQDGEFDLDLSYITREIIAMGLPGSQLREKLIRNDEVDVANMLNKYHPARYMIFNLSEKKYSYELFHNAVIDCGWPDHHPPTLYQLFEIINTMVIFLRGNPDNVVVVHCKAGKGRTGTIIVCLLIYCGLFDRESALKYFAYRRGNSTSAKAGVTIPSQLRYVEYFDKVLHGFQMSKKAYMLHRIVVHGVPVKDKRNGVRLFVKLYQNNTDLIYSTSARSVRLTESDDTAKIDVNVVLKGDILVRFKAQHMLKSEELFRCNFHTGFVGDTLILSLGKYDLDDAHKDSNVDEDFRVELIFSQVGGDEEDEGVREREEREEGRSRSGGIALPLPAPDAALVPLAAAPPVLPPRGPKPPLPRRQATVAAESGTSSVPVPVSAPVVATSASSTDKATDTRTHVSADFTRTHATVYPADARATQRTQHLRVTARGLVYVRADGSELLLSDEEAEEEDTRVSIALSVGKHVVPVPTPVPAPVAVDACEEAMDEESEVDACECGDSDEDDDRGGEEEEEEEHEVGETEDTADTVTDLPALSSLPCLPSNVPSHSSTLPSLSLDDDTSMECPTYHTLTPTPVPTRTHADATVASHLSPRPHHTPTTPALPSPQHTSPPFLASSPRVPPAHLGAASPQLRAASPFSSPSSAPAHRTAPRGSTPSSPFVPAVDGKPDEHGDSLGSLSSLHSPTPLSPQRTGDSTSTSTAPPTYTNPTSPTSSAPSPTPRLSQLLAQAPTRKSTLSEANYEPWRDAIINRGLYTGLLHTMVYSSDTVEARKEKEKLAKTGKSGSGGTSGVDARLSFGERGRSVGGDEGGRQATLNTTHTHAPTHTHPHTHTSSDATHTPSAAAPLPPPPPQRPQRTGRLHAHAQTIAFTPQMLASARASIDQGVGGKGVRATGVCAGVGTNKSNDAPTATAITTTTAAVSVGADVGVDVQPVPESAADASTSTRADVGTGTSLGTDAACASVPSPAVELFALPRNVTAATDIATTDTSTLIPAPAPAEDTPTMEVVSVSFMGDAHVPRGRPRRLNAPVPHDFPSMQSQSAFSGCDDVGGDVDSDVDNAFLRHDPLSPQADAHASLSACADGDDIAELHGLGMYANMSLSLAGKYSYTNANSNANSFRDDADLDAEQGLESDTGIPRSSTLNSLSSNDSGSSKHVRPPLPSKQGRIMELAAADMRRRSVKLDGEVFGQARGEEREVE